MVKVYSKPRNSFSRMVYFEGLEREAVESKALSFYESTKWGYGNIYQGIEQGENGLYLAKVLAYNSCD